MLKQEDWYQTENFHCGWILSLLLSKNPKTLTTLQGMIFLNLNIRMNDYTIIFFFFILLRHWYKHSCLSLSFETWIFLHFSHFFILISSVDFFSHFSIRILFLWISVLILVTFSLFLWKFFLLPNNGQDTWRKIVNSHLLAFSWIS